MLFDQNTLSGNWREQVLHCRDKGISIDREIVFALAVADLLQLPDDIPLMPAVTAAMFIPVRLSDRASLAHLKPWHIPPVVGPWQARTRIWGQVTE